MKKIYLLALSLSLLFVSCDEIGSNLEPIDGYEYDAVTPEAVADALVHLHPDKEICEEVHTAVRKAVSFGLDESYYFCEVLGKENRITKVNRNIQAKLNSLPTGNSIKEILAKVVEDEKYMNHYQIYWPYSENWDGNTMPTITFQTEAAVEQEENVGYRIVKDRIEEVNVDEEYAKQHPVWIINFNPIPYEEYPDFAQQNWTHTDRMPHKGGFLSERITYYAKTYIQGSKKNPQLPNYIHNFKEIDFKQDTLSLYLKNIQLKFKSESMSFFSGGLHYLFIIPIDDEDEPEMSELIALSDLEIKQKLIAEIVSIRFTLLRSNIDLKKAIVVSSHALLSWQWLNYEELSEYSVSQEIPKRIDDYPHNTDLIFLYYGEEYKHWWGYTGVYIDSARLRLISRTTICREGLKEDDQKI